MIKLMKGVAAAAVLSMAAAGTAHAGISTLFTPGGDAPGGSDTLLYDFDGTGNVGDFSQCLIVELEHGSILDSEQQLILFHKSVFRLFEDSQQQLLVELMNRADNRKPA